MENIQKKALDDELNKSEEEVEDSIKEQPFGSRKVKCCECGRIYNALDVNVVPCSNGYICLNCLDHE